MIHILEQQDSPTSVYISQIRDKEIQKDSMRFRTNITRIGQALAMEIGKTLNYKTIETTTPLGIAKSRVISDQIVIASILRAAIPMHQGFLNIFDNAENAFLSEYRSYNPDNTFEIKFEYMSSPSINGKTLIIADPMLATGQSIVTAINGLLQNGTPQKIHIASIIASKQGIEHIETNTQGLNIEIWTAALDPILNAHGYIVPGLGDAGDLCFGQKL